MIIEKIELSHFRNYEELSVDFSQDTNILYGDNAQGKTNLLEAIYLCSTTKSHRSSKDRELIQFGSEEAHIKMMIKKREVPFRIDMHIKKNRSKGIAINGIPIKKASELFGIVNVVFFSPEDLEIVKGSPSIRRRFLDLELCQLDKIYVSNLVNYNKCMLQRNKLLKEMDFFQSDYTLLDIWDIQLAKYGIEIITRREQFIQQLNQIMQSIHHRLTNGKEQIKIEYEKSCKKEELYEQLVSNRKKDIRFRTTSVGPHRDDLIFLSHEMDLRKYGSQGQQRTAALSLKLSEIQIVEQMIHDTPILLLDDVLSELDSNRQHQLLNSLKNVQTFITCTGLDEFIQNRFNINEVYRVVEGSVIRVEA